MTLIEKLKNIQIKLKAPKGQFNDFGKYKYRSCEDILEAVKPLLNETKTVLTLSDEMKEVGGRVYVVATARLRDTESVEIIEVTANAREEETKKGMDGSQITGAASSYARKYALNGLFAIDDTKDSDYTNKGDDDKTKAKPKTNKAEKVKLLVEKLKEQGTLEQTEKWAKVDHDCTIPELPENLIDALLKKCGA